MIFECVKCKNKSEQEIVRVLDYGYRGTVIVRKDHRGKRSYNGVCWDCRRSYERKSRGYSSRELSQKPMIMAAVDSERAAQAHFERLGFRVERVDAIGPDLKCFLGDFVWTVEVKRARFGSRSWRTCLVRPKRIKDDLLAIVLPNGRVYIDSMALHLEKCGKSGRRSVTGLVKRFGTTPL